MAFRIQGEMISRRMAWVLKIGAILLGYAVSNTALAGSFEARVTHRHCDVEEQVLDGDVKRSSSDLEMVLDGDAEQIIGICFEEVNIPPGTVVTNAYIQFTNEFNNQTKETNLTITGHALDAPERFLDIPYTVSSRLYILTTQYDFQ